MHILQNVKITSTALKTYGIKLSVFYENTMAFRTSFRFNLDTKRATDNFVNLVWYLELIYVGFLNDPNAILIFPDILSVLLALNGIFENCIIKTLAIIHF